MEPKDKASELINEYYTYAKSEREAISMVENVILTTLCQKIDSLDGHVFFRKDFDEDLIKSSIKGLKYWQEVACEVEQRKKNLPV